ncbi:ATP-dependent nuclease [Lactobacillus delbrueckii]|uniref:ATP-dependent nuclease n=1 Tax=Lactobacillus delbrueckii TaxID=1584 RepID=UPI0022DFA011|nr:AAA family ATPase [Lactobacillus delbrueckii]
MLLRAVELHNFRGYRNFKLKFAPLTSLLGEGEVGKKTILRALDIFFNGPLAKRPLKLQDLNEKALKAGDWQIAITCYFDDFAIKKSFDLKQYLEESDSFAEEGGDFQPVTDQNRGRYRQLSASMPLYVFFDEESKAASPLNFVVRSAIRDKAAEIKEIQDYLDDRLGRSLSQLLANYRDLGEPAPQFVFQDPNLAELIKQREKVGVTGTAKVSRIILAFLLAQSENASIDNVVYAFEANDLSEEDESLLAQALLKLVAKNKQVILIPRTPHLMGLLPLEGIKIIKKVAGQQQLLSDSQILAEVSSSLGLAADQRAVKSRCVLLVEGQEDVRFVTKINQWMYEEKLVDATFAEKGLFILPVGGCGSLLAWLNFDLFSKLNEPWFILIDSDKGTDEAKQSQRHLHRIRAKYPGMQTHIHATFKREIENYLVFKEGKKTHVFAPYEDVKQHMYDLMQQRHQSWSKDKTASKLMEQMDLADLQDYYEKDGQKHRELVEYFLQIDHFIDGLA